MVSWNLLHASLSFFRTPWILTPTAPRAVDIAEGSSGLWASSSLQPASVSARISWTRAAIFWLKSRQRARSACSDSSAMEPLPPSRSLFRLFARHRRAAIATHEVQWDLLRRATAHAAQHPRGLEPD